jgi:hypothetical protein
MTRLGVQSTRAGAPATAAAAMKQSTERSNGL